MWNNLLDFYCTVQATETLEPEIERTKAFSIRDDGYTALYAAIFRSAARSRDIEYFKSDTFLYHCNLIGIERDLIITNLSKQMQKQLKK